MNENAWASALLIAALASTAAVAQAPQEKPREEKPKLLVSDLTAQGVEPAEAAAITDAVVSALTERGLFRVISSKDVQTILSAERQRQLLGQCGQGEDDGEGCATNLGEALEASFVLTGSLSKVGSAYQLTLQTVDTVKSRPIARSTRLAGELATLTLIVPYAAAEATGSPLPPPRSRVLQYSMMATGSGLLIGGGILGALTLSRESVLNQQLCPPDGEPGPDGTCDGVNLLELAAYEREDQSLGRNKLVSVGLLGAGAALIATGLLLMPPPEATPQIALVPSDRGFALVGVFP